MIKVVYCLRRNPRLTREEFQKHWRTIHAPMVRKYARVLGIKRYMQMHTGDPAFNEGVRGVRGGPEPYDGIAELWWNSAEEMAACAASPEGQKAARECLEDEKLFIDHASSPVSIGEENWVIARE
jgi:uncharacterized protein (TIGR02118 family)